jgi:hypothetical protein
MKDVWRSALSLPYPQTQQPSISSVLGCPDTMRVPLLPHLGQSATPFHVAICRSSGDMAEFLQI